MLPWLLRPYTHCRSHLSNFVLFYFTLFFGTFFLCFLAGNICIGMEGFENRPAYLLTRPHSFQTDGFHLAEKLRSHLSIFEILYFILFVLFWYFLCSLFFFLPKISI